MAKVTLINRQVRKNYAELADGTLVEIKNIQSPEQYGKGVTVYENKLAKGAKAGSSEFSVAVEDYIPAKRVSTKESVNSMLASGLTPEEIVAKLAGNA